MALKTVSLTETDPRKIATAVNLLIGQVQALYATALNIKKFGARGDGYTDDTAALQRALDAARGQAIYFPEGRYFIRRNGLKTYCLLWRYPASLIGAGPHSTVILLASDVPTDVDGIRIDPEVSAEEAYFWSMEGLSVLSIVQPTPAQPGLIQTGRDAIHAEIDDVASEYLPKFLIHRCWLGRTSRRAFSFTKGTEGTHPVAVPSNGLFTSVFSDGFYYGGVYCDRVVSLDNSGDAIVWTDNSVVGDGIGIYTKPVNGAAQQIFRGGIITAEGGAFYAKGGTQIRLENVQMEQSSAYTGDQDAMVVFDGTTESHVTGCNLNSWGRVSNIRFKGGAARNRCRFNTMTVDTAADSHFVFDADAGTRNDIGLLTNSYLDNTGPALKSQPTISDSSTVAQIGVAKSLTLASSWVAHGSATFGQGLTAALYDDGTVVISGTIKDGTNLAGTTLFTLPVGMRPLGRASLLTIKYDNAGWQYSELQALTNGEVQLTAALGATSRVSFDNVLLRTF